MAFDGITVANLTHDLKQAIEGGRIAKIAQPEKDELLFQIKKDGSSVRLLVSASASLPLVYLTDANKPSPMTAPNFCMLLRKHIGSARIISVSQPGLERIIEITLEHLDDMGDVCRKRLIIEIMGKHSNIIFCKEDGTILDSIKHISAQVSSVREVLPGRMYFIPHTMEKSDPFTVSLEEFADQMTHAPMAVQKALYNRLTGISPIIAEELCCLASINPDKAAGDLTEDETVHLYRTLTLMMEDVTEGNFFPNIVYDGDVPAEFASLPLTCFDSERFSSRKFDSVSQVLRTYYSSRETITRIRQKSSDLRRIVQTALERNYKKYDLQLKQLKDTEKQGKIPDLRRTFKHLRLRTCRRRKRFKCLNYYTNEEVQVPLDPQLSARENAQKAFDKYNKLKRTFEALNDLTKETKEEIDHLESISAALDIALEENDLVQIKEELMEYGYIKKRRAGEKRPKITSRPFHYLSSDGFHIYVGKNNYQNEELTFKLANGGDWWFHAKGIPGSHVIVKTEGKELPDRVFEEAGRPCRLVFQRPRQ